MIPRPLLLGGCGAAGLFLGFPNPLLHLPPLSLLYPLALYLLGKEAPARCDALRRGWLTGLAGASAGLYWLALPVHNVGGLPWPLAIPCAMGIGAYVGCYGGIFCLCIHALRRRPPLHRGLLAGLLWYALELLRGALFTGFPWLTQAAAFAPWPVAIQGASVVGAYALGGVFVAMTCLAAERRRACLAVAAGMLAAVLVFGICRLDKIPPLAALPATQVFPVTFAEGNIDQNQKWDAAIQQFTVDRYIQLTRDALKHHDGPPPLVIWPETALPFYYQEHRRHAPRVRELARETGIALLLGAPGYIKTGYRKFQVFNRAFLIDAAGRDVGYYDKEHLVPFGEFLPPWLDFPFLVPLLQGVGTFTPGQAVKPLRTGNLALGILICYESIFPELAQDRVAAGANVLTNISNDGWFGDSSAPEQHLHMAALRAVEQERWLLRGTNTGISGIYDPAGRLVVRGGQFREGTVTGWAATLTRRSPYHHLAPWIPWAAMFLIVVLLIFPKGAAPHGQRPAD